MTETHRIVGGGDDMGGAHQVAILYHDPDPRLMERNPNAAADALLIAAAPDLLEQLAALADYLDEVDVQNSLACGPAGLERAAALQFIARHAIAKATGGAR